jgi:DNA-binding MarR family transcriptional regulator
MFSETQFSQVLREWAEVFMRRSMREFFLFSKDSGMSMSQLSTLMRLFHQGGCGVSDIGDQLGITNAAASQLIDKLVQQGLVQRSEGVPDRRMKHIALTEKGQALVHESIEVRRRWMEDLTIALSPEEQQAITKAFVILTRAALDIEPQSVAA